MYGRVDLPELQILHSHFKAHPVVSISHHQRMAMSNANWLDTVHHGLPVDQYSSILNQRQTAYAAPNDLLPPELKDLSYDTCRTLRFRPEQPLWREAELPFQVQFFHRGFLFAPRVDVYEVSQGRARPIRYAPSQFTFEVTPAPKPDAALGYAGLRLHS
ncbi:MAG: glucan biosynthesis protein, partial [Lautropia sp.]